VTVGALVDLHSHVLPGVDDGALDEADALAMGRRAERDGITVVCATPHIRHDHGVQIEGIARRVEALNAAFARAGVAVQVVPGAEVAEPIVGELSDHELRACTLGAGGAWILLEPAPGPLSSRTVATVRSLRERGLRTVLAHPERHPATDLGERLREIIALGGLVQVTAEFVLDGSADWFVAERLVHVLGSDAHSSHGGRPLAIAAALERLVAAAAFAPHAAWIAHDAPRALVAGRDVEVPYQPRALAASSSS
jgi:protein-tyrosine phosphatase